jgi:hypothetical protein
MRRPAHLALIGGALLGLPGAKADAAAWTQAPGAGFASIVSTFYGADDGGYEEATLGLYGEYGVAEGWTLGAAADLSQPTGPASAIDGDVTLFAFARRRLWAGPEGDPVSVQLGVIAGTTAGLGEVPAQTADEPGLDMRALYGRGFSSAIGKGWLNAEAALRLRFEESADEIRIDLTAGLRPAPRWLAMLQSFATIGLENAETNGDGFPIGDDYSVWKLAPSVGYEIGPGLTLVGGVEREIAGRDIERGLRGRLALWRSF